MALMRESKSAIQEDMNCIICRSPYTEYHHCIKGRANRKIADKYGLGVYLCKEHHTGNTGVHKNRDMDLELIQLAQTHYEAHIGSREEFIKDFGKSWL